MIVWFTIAVHNTAQNNSDDLPPYLQGNLSHCTECSVVYCRKELEILNTLYKLLVGHMSQPSKFWWVMVPTKFAEAINVHDTTPGLIV